MLGGGGGARRETSVSVIWSTLHLAECSNIFCLNRSSVGTRYLFISMVTALPPMDPPEVKIHQAQIDRISHMIVFGLKIIHLS